MLANVETGKLFFRRNPNANNRLEQLPTEKRGPKDKGAHGYNTSQLCHEELEASAKEEAIPRCAQGQLLLSKESHGQGAPYSPGEVGGNGPDGIVDSNAVEEKNRGNYQNSTD